MELGPVLMLADHLDATLALAEDLVALKLNEQKPDEPDPRSPAVVGFAQKVRALELGITSRLIQARRRGKELVLPQQEIMRLVDVFVGGTAIVENAVSADALGETEALALATGPAALDFLKMRGVVAQDLAVMDDIDALAVGEEYAALGMLPLGPLMDMMAAVLDALDLAFDLYGPRSS